MYKVQSFTKKSFQLEDDNELFSSKTLESSIPSSIDLLSQDLLFNEQSSCRHYCKRALIPIPIQWNMPVTSIRVHRVRTNTESVVPDLALIREKALLRDMLDKKAWNIIMPPKNEFDITLKITEIVKAQPEL